MRAVKSFLTAVTALKESLAGPKTLRLMWEGRAYAHRRANNMPQKCSDNHWMRKPSNVRQRNEKETLGNLTVFTVLCPAPQSFH